MTSRSSNINLVKKVERGPSNACPKTEDDTCRDRDKYTENSARKKKDPTRKKLVFPFAKSLFERGVAGLREDFKANPRICKLNEMPTFVKNNATGRNRYKDVGCVEDTRVKLTNYENDYIHANYVNTFGHEKRFICTQAPLEKTCADFWQMIIQEEVETIVMLCNVMEKQNNACPKKKCHEYYPDNEGEKMTFGNYTITSKYSKKKKFGKVKTDTVVTESRLDVECTDGRKKRVKHYHWIDWPDRDTPEPDLVIIKLLEDCNKSSKPIVVHCSAGVGRTGVMVLIQAVLDLLGCGQELPETLVDLTKEVRKQRNNSIQTEPQYLFVHMVLLNYFVETGSLDSTAKSPTAKFRADFNKAIAAVKQMPK